MVFGEYHFQAILEDEAHLPPFKGSTFRGVFGWALKSVVCALKRQECPSCLLRQQCIYTKVFELPPDLQPQGKPHPPHPFVIEPPLDPRTYLPPGESFDFTLLLFGAANQYLPYFVYAFQEMGKIGIGRRAQGHRARFRLLAVASPNTGIIYHHEDGSLSPGALLDLKPMDVAGPGPPVDEITLTLLTPLRLKYQNRLQAELPFHVLVRGVLRRITVLASHYGDGEPSLDYRGLVHRAQEVQTVQSSLYWLDWERYSQRQAQAMLLGGLMGSITYRGELGEYLPLLRFAEKVHVGKNSTFGLGLFKVCQASGD
ncbi:MAG: CRISPR system precrRNA processing endoribonuclease RAMP protein Cas6 [Deltaproteobacteria bacterium]|nr:CRISPR system precrRNA processing endoribonuclease RAMP protein Cas6 [Deltaproteobacteria bacterium]